MLFLLLVLFIYDGFIYDVCRLLFSQTKDTWKGDETKDPYNKYIIYLTSISLL